MLTGSEAIREAQRTWAKANGICADFNGYVDKVETNLRAPLSARARRGYEKGSRVGVG